MRFAVVPMRSHGRPLPRAELTNPPPWIGDLRIEEIRDEQLMRCVRTVRVLILDRQVAPNVLGELYEPQSPQALTLSGYQRVGDQCYAQSWLVLMIGHSSEIRRRLPGTVDVQGRRRSVYRALVVKLQYVVCVHPG